MSDKLTDKQKRFAEEYVIDLNATQAAIRAGYARGSAEVTGFRLLRYDKIDSYLRKLMDKRSKRTEVTQDRVLLEYAKLAFLQPKKFYGEDGELLPIPELEDDVAAALTSFDVVQTVVDGKEVSQTKKIKFADKKGALDSCARHLGMFNDKLELSGEVKNMSDEELDRLLFEKLKNMPERVKEWDK